MRLFDRVQDFTETEGTGAVTLSLTPPVGFRTFNTVNGPTPGISITTIQNGAPDPGGQNEIQRITLTGVTGGTFKINPYPEEAVFTRNLSPSVSFSDFEMAIYEDLMFAYAPGSFTISGIEGQYYDLEWSGGGYAKTNRPLSELNGSLLTFVSATDRFYYALVHHTETEWECGIGYLSDSDTFERMVVLSNSEGTTDKINFSAGLKTIFCDATALAVFDQFAFFDPVVAPKAFHPNQTNKKQQALFGQSLGNNVTVSSGTTTLTAPLYCDTLTVASGATLYADGYRIHARLILCAGTISAKGANGANGSGTTGGSQATTPAVGEYNYGIGNISAGKGTNGTDGHASPATPATPAAVAYGDGGGITTRLRPPVSYWLNGQVAGGGQGGQGGQGGTGPGGGGGAGGNGGGRLLIIADTIIVQSGGSITANGGNGGNGASTATINCSGGEGGDAGSGGFVYIACNNYHGTYPTAVSGTGGTGGTGGGGSGVSGTNGASASDGTVVLYNFDSKTYLTV